MGQRIAQSVYDFRIMRENGYRYVDKTDLLYPLIMRDGDAFYFISRPRRFGKSLMLSTLECIFRGRRDLFQVSHPALQLRHDEGGDLRALHATIRGARLPDD